MKRVERRIVKTTEVIHVKAEVTNTSVPDQSLQSEPHQLRLHQFDDIWVSFEKMSAMGIDGWKIDVPYADWNCWVALAEAIIDRNIRMKITEQINASTG
jgi:hypothetical protein